jgi:signal transduction histidine kinase
MFRSLRFRLAASYAIASLVILAIFAALVFVLLSRSLDHGATDQLQSEASGQVERIEEGGSLEPMGDIDVPSASAVQIAVYSYSGSVAIGEPKENNPSWLKPYPARVTDLEVAGERVRVVTLSAAVGGRPIAEVAAGRSLQPEEALIDRVRSLFTWGGALVLVASLVAGWWWAGRAMGPVERSYEAQAGFAADASHELRTPLAFIRAGVETLAEGDPALADDVLREVDYLSTLSQRLLQLARADRGRLELERSAMDLGKACRSAAHRCMTASATAVTTDGDDGVIVAGDRVALEAALDAVLENVGRHGGCDAELSWWREGDHALVAVVDHGKGMSVDLHHRAFERFFRADPSRSRETGGAGLGLPLARALIEAQRGRMWLEPTEGGGVTAMMSLPIA